MIFGYLNLLVDSVLSASNQDSNYPIENIYDTRLSKIFRSVSTSVRIVHDAGLGNTANPSMITINAHNITNGATIKIEANDSDSWGSPSFSQNITYNDLCIVKFFIGSAYRYWSIYIDDSENTDGYIKIGHSFLGDYLQLDFKVGNDFSIFIQENSKKTVSPTGQVYGHNSGEWLKGYNLNLEWISNDEKDNLLIMYNNVRNYKPFYFVIDEDYINDLPVLYCTIDNSPEFKHIAGYNWTVSYNLLEAK